jgi:renalase
MTSSISDVLIIGAGISGLSAAKVLEGRGYTVTLVDKGRGYGGRLSTRRIKGLRFDHGAQYFTARSDEFKTEVARWKKNGWVKKWFDSLTFSDERVDKGSYPRFVPKAVGMTSLPKSLAEELTGTVHRGERVKTLAYADNIWTATCDSGKTLQGRTLLMTSPIPQTLEILETSKLTLNKKQAKQLKDIRYAPSLAIMLMLKKELFTDLGEGMKFPDKAPLSWVGNNTHKYKQDKANIALTLHASAAFSAKHFESEEAVILDALLETIQPYAALTRESIAEKQLHRWRYAFSENPLDQTFFNAEIPSHEGASLALAGDAFGERAKIEGAWRSGVDAANHLATQLSAMT